MRATRPRLLVLALLHRLGGHHSVDALVARLGREGTALPRGSVYAVVDTLVRRGLVMLTDAGPGRALYEAGKRWHHHFVCVQCGTVVDVACVRGAKPCLAPDRVPGAVHEAQVIFRGRCQRCLGRRKTARKTGGGRQAVPAARQRVPAQVARNTNPATTTTAGPDGKSSQ